MDILPTGTPALIPSIAGDPVAGALNATQFLDVDMKEFSGVLTLVSHHGWCGIQRGELVKTMPLQDA
jgi:hypothetical protein